MEILQYDEASRLQGEDDVITPQLLDHLRPSLVALEKALEPLAERKVRTATTRTVEDTLALVRGLLKRELAATVTFSPARRFPSITAGPRSLWWFFDALWERVARVALVSATLYLPREMADESYGLIKTVLHLPADRIGTFSPITDHPALALCRRLACAGGCGPWSADAAPGDQDQLRRDGGLSRGAGSVACHPGDPPGGDLRQCGRWCAGPAAWVRVDRRTGPAA